MNVNDYLQSETFQRRQQAEIEATIRRQHEARRTALVAETVTQHPGWGWFLREADAIRGQVQAAHDALRDEIAHGEALGEPLAALKLRLHRTWGGIEALDMVLRLVPDALRMADGPDAPADPDPAPR